jgi:tmRNA-binding protein
MQPRWVLRALLRVIDTHVTRVSGNVAWRRYVLDSFRAHALERDPERSRALLLLAREYADLIANVAHHRVSFCAIFTCVCVGCAL